MFKKRTASLSAREYSICIFLTWLVPRVMVFTAIPFPHLEHLLNHLCQVRRLLWSEDYEESPSKVGAFEDTLEVFSTLFSRLYDSRNL